MYRAKHGPSIWSRLKALEWFFGAIAGGLVIGMPFWMILLGII